MKKIQIAIIDSGVNCFHPAFSNSKPVLVHDEEQINSKNFYGHGTAIYNIIRKVENIAEITNFKLSNVEFGTCENDLIRLLKRIKSNYKFDIINLSLGINICEKLEDFYHSCLELTDAGTIILSAFDNTGSISFPAAFENVIGVTTGRDCIRINDFEYIQDTVVNLGAKGNVQRLAWNNPDYIVLGGNSFACAHATVQVAKFMAQGIRGFDNIMNAFKSISKNEYINRSEISLKHGNELPFLIKKAALFPFNKEMHSLIRYSSELSFEIVGVYDSKYSANVGSTTSHIMNSDVTCLPIQNISMIQWDEFDTLILGHLDEMSNLIDKHNLKIELIRSAIEHGKHIYAFDDVSSIASSSSIYSPKVSEEDLPPYRFGKLYRFSKPIVGVYGTSSRQGKFTLQLELRRHLIKLGYKVGQIGTEPSALLYGMDYVYPMGYNNSVYLNDYEAIRYLNNLIFHLCNKEIDIVITGSQSGTVPFDTGNIIQYSLPQFSYLLGTQPDVVLLCINPFDDLDYIMRTKQFIEASVNCKVIAFVVFPLDIKDDWTGIYGQRIIMTDEKYTKLKSTIKERFSLPVYKLGDESDMDLIVHSIINYFSADDEDVN